MTICSFSVQYIASWVRYKFHFLYFYTFHDSTDKPKNIFWLTLKKKINKVCILHSNFLYLIYQVLAKSHCPLEITHESHLWLHQTQETGPQSKQSRRKQSSQPEVWLPTIERAYFSLKLKFGSYENTASILEVERTHQAFGTVSAWLRRTNFWSKGIWQRLTLATNTYFSSSSLAHHWIKFWPVGYEQMWYTQLADLGPRNSHDPSWFLSLLHRRLDVAHPVENSYTQGNSRDNR